jgi:hypothetical protein
VALAQTAGGQTADLTALEAAVEAHPELGAQEPLDAVLAAAQGRRRAKPTGRTRRPALPR